MEDVTTILRQLEKLGPDEASSALLPLVYGELHRLAEAYMRRERAGHTLQPTALVHEAWMNLVDSSDRSFRNRAHFLGVAARAMRRVLVDHARSRDALKRGGDRVRVTMDEGSAAVDARDVIDLVALDVALEKLATQGGRIADVVELRFFGGLTIAETAAALDVSHTTVEDDWSLARAWLSRELADDAR